MKASTTGSISVDRQTHLVAGLILVFALTLSQTVDPRWIWLAVLPTFGLLLDAFTGICPMRLVLRATHWNRERV